MFKTWNLFLIIATFALSLLGTFLVRSGVLSSVHAFANDPGRGVYILIFMAVVLLFSFGVLTMRSDALKSDTSLTSIWSRETTYLFNNLFLVVATFTVLLGTMYPLAVETLSDAKVTVGAPYYNQVFLPIMLGLLVLMGVGPVIPWRRASWAGVKRQFMVPLLVGVVALIVAWIVGVRHIYGWLAVGVIGFVMMTHLNDIRLGVSLRCKKEGIGRSVAFLQMINRNRRRYGGFVVHFGVLMMSAGFIGSGMFQQELNLTVKDNDVIHVGPWEVRFDGVTEMQQRNWTATEATVQAQRGSDGEKIVLKPQQRIYKAHQQPTTEAAIYTSWREDLYVVLGDEVGGAWGFKVFYNPLVAWIWWGAGLMAFGVVIAMTRWQRQA